MTGNDDIQGLASGPVGPPPPMAEELNAALENLPPKPTRHPLKQWAQLAAGSSAFVALLLVFFRTRRDLPELPTSWVITFAIAWLLGFSALAFVILVPKKGAVMSRFRSASGLLLFAAATFIVGGLWFSKEVAGLSVTYEPTLKSVVAHSPYCLSMGSLTALAPMGLGALFLRGAAPVGTRRTGAAIGAAGGCLGGFFLHLHCHIAEANHVGWVHGGLILTSAVLGALILPRFLRP